MAFEQLDDIGGKAAHAHLRVMAYDFSGRWVLTVNSLVTTLRRWFGWGASGAGGAEAFDAKQLLREAGYEPGPEDPVGPDWSYVDSPEKAKALVTTGVLVELLLVPEEFGGPRVPENTVYVPPVVEEMKYRTDMNIIRPLIMDGRVTLYIATPEHVGPCMVPIAIMLKATEPGQFTCNLAIWGAALRRG